jgi:phospholipid/cholesterol/gamma-HCH transport system substrate-binding protein
MAGTLKLSKKTIRGIVTGVVLAVALGIGAYFLFSGADMKKLSAQFDSAVGVYPGTPVKILGVDVGDVTSVHPGADYVTINLEYDSKYRVPDNAIVVVVANSLVSDRYLQLSWPTPKSKTVIADGAVIPKDRTAGPAELDDIYAALNKLSVALGPQGANKNGALSEFVKISDANLKGNGAALGDSITRLSQAITTLSNGREDLFGTVRNLQSLTSALADSDSQIKHFEEQLAQVSGDLASERSELGEALHDLGGALDTVASFVKDNQDKLHTDLGGLQDISKLLVDDQAAINETLAVGPVALANIVHAYQPNIGAIATRGNLASLTDPANICQVLNLGGYLSPVAKLLPPTLLKPVIKTCTKILKNLPDGSKLTLPSGLSPEDIQKLLDALGGGGLGGVITGG